MAKDKGSEDAKEMDAQEPRKLNMEEKRKLEKLLLADIDSAVERYNAQAEGMRRTLIEKLAKNPPAEAKKLFESFKLSQKQQSQLEAKLDELGYDISYDGSLRVNTSGNKATELRAFDKLADDVRQSLQSLKRSYVIQLFADHADTQSLFASLTKELAKLVG